MLVAIALMENGMKYHDAVDTIRRSVMYIHVYTYSTHLLQWNPLIWTPMGQKCPQVEKHASGTMSGVRMDQVPLRISFNGVL